VSHNCNDIEPSLQIVSACCSSWSGPVSGHGLGTLCALKPQGMPPGKRGRDFLHDQPVPMDVDAFLFTLERTLRPMLRPEAPSSLPGRTQRQAGGPILYPVATRDWICQPPSPPWSGGAYPNQHACAVPQARCRQPQGSCGAMSPRAERRSLRPS